ncbi:hypothetical protein [Nocardia sp. NPDC052566]|uniref:hypothetical protein n=1 Tax=Nocardia sp. NPDC052566 TaxID=3364330 RepID=UPI0037CAF5E5
MSAMDTTEAWESGRWRADLLLRIVRLSADHTRIARQGYEGYDGDGTEDGPRQAWLDHLRGLEAEREQLETVARSAGVDATEIADARALGLYTQRLSVRNAVPDNISRQSAGQEFLLEMLSVDLWNLEHMAMLHAARADRIATGRWTVGLDPDSIARFQHNMEVRRTRVVAMADAIEVSAAEAELLWGPASTESWGAHARLVEAYDEATLAAQWTRYADAPPELPMPPYIPTDSATGAPLTRAAAAPPPIREFLDDASKALSARFIEVAVGDGDGDGSAIAEAIQAALPGINASSQDFEVSTDTTSSTTDTIGGPEPPAHHTGTDLGIDT